jgi:hypothetical protein
MPLGDRRYRSRVPLEARRLAATVDMPLPNDFIAGADAPPYFPEGLRAFVFGPELEAADRDDAAVPLVTDTSRVKVHFAGGFGDVDIADLELKPCDALHHEGFSRLPRNG